MKHNFTYDISIPLLLLPFSAPLKRSSEIWPDCKILVSLSTSCKEVAFLIASRILSKSAGDAPGTSINQNEYIL